MTDFKRALIALDLSGMDRHLMTYAAFIKGVLEVEKIYFVHIMPDFNVPKHADVEFQKLFAPEHPIDEKVREKLANDIESVFGIDKELDLSVEVIEGKPYDKLMHWTNVKDIDLLIVGHKEISEGSGITARRVARKTRCNVLFVPEMAPTEIRRVVVPIDFSENSARALRRTLDLTRILPDLEVQALYVVDMPPGDYYMQPYEDAGFRRVLIDSARSAYLNFLRENQLEEEDIEPVFMENNFVNVAAHITEYVGNNDVDLIVLGAQGHSALENFIYGSVTENLVERCRQAPILIIR